jgi:hypothetical protein
MGECGGDVFFDECGECGGDNSLCTGCMDLHAYNYDPDAIVPCDDCCEYQNNEGVIVINEINYNPALSFGQADADYEVVELYNNIDDSINLVDWRFLSDDGINIIFGDLTLYPGEYLLLASNIDTYPGSIEYDAPMGLSNSGETLTLTDSNGQIVGIVTYSDGFQGEDDPWPPEADAEGATLPAICNIVI